MTGSYSSDSESWSSTEKPSCCRGESGNNITVVTVIRCLAWHGLDIATEAISSTSFTLFRLAVLIYSHTIALCIAIVVLLIILKVDSSPAVPTRATNKARKTNKGKRQPIVVQKHYLDSVACIRTHEWYGKPEMNATGQQHLLAIVVRRTLTNEIRDLSKNLEKVERSVYLSCFRRRGVIWLKHLLSGSLIPLLLDYMVHAPLSNSLIDPYIARCMFNMGKRVHFQTC